MNETCPRCGTHCGTVSGCINRDQVCATDKLADAANQLLAEFNSHGGGFYTLQGVGLIGSRACHKVDRLVKILEEL